MTDNDETDARLRAWGEQTRRSMSERAGGLAPARPMRGRWIAVSASVASALVVAAVAGVLVARNGGPDPTTTERTPPASTTSNIPATKQVTYGGLAVSVPVAWQVNDEYCSTPQHDTVLLPHGVLGCATFPKPRGLTVVEFDDGRGVSALRNSATRQITVDGRPGTESTGTGDPYGAGTMRAVRIAVPSVAAAFTVYAPTAAQAQAIAGTAAVVDHDSNGCVAQVRYAPLPDTPRPDVDGAADSLLPGSPVSLAVCQYDGNMLAAGAPVPSSELTGALATLRALPAGYVVSGGTTQYSGCTAGLRGVRSVDTFDQEWFVLLARYADGRTLELRARLGFCGYLGVTNGVFAAGLPRNLGTDLRMLLGLPGIGFGNPEGYRPAG